MNLLKKHSVIALSYFLLIAVLGVLLRCFSIIAIDFNYKYLVHACFHVALLGWVYTALMILIYLLFLKSIDLEKKYRRVFWFTQITIIGMLITFPFTGYALFSILFSTLFLFASYIFSYLVFKHTPKQLKTTNSYKCIKWSLWYMIISSLGPWALGIIMNTLGETSSWYRNAIYFYLHFQYNGWFILALFGILFRVFEKHHINISSIVFKRFFYLFNSGIIITFLISILWMKLSFVINIIAVLGGLIQIIAFIILLKEIIQQKEKIYTIFSNRVMKLFKIIVFLFSIKLFMQFVGSFPSVSNTISFTIDFVIGYLHWIFLGIVSLSLLVFMHFFKLLRLTKSSIIIYLIGFFLTEILIFYRGFSIWRIIETSDYYNHYLFFASVLFLVSISFILFNKKKKNSINNKNENGVLKNIFYSSTA